MPDTKTKLLTAMMAAAGHLTFSHVGNETTPPEQTDTPALDENETFHMHLDRCTQCREHPFNLCKTGDRLIVEAARKIKKTPL